MTLPVTMLSGVDEGSGVPKYRQIADQLTRLIEDLPPGVRLPSEPAISRHLGVSRNTAIQALHELQRRGLAVRRQGRGTFTAERHRAVRSLAPGRLPSFSEDLRRGGHTTAEEMVGFERAPLPAEPAARLGVDLDTIAWRVERVIRCDDAPVVHVLSWLPVELYPSLDPVAISKSSLYEHLESGPGAGRPHSAEEEWTAVAADEHVARLLGLPVPAPVMSCRRTAVLADGRPAEHSVSALAGGRFAIAVRISPSSWVDGVAPVLQVGSA
ncbi:GntR family transcriptional regulator [Actinophytocola gossypii]|uniref:GntR family transcriptional regulator n=1 Tax=Actinophytocola gossypii TaxID=2812003 RepID=A0ABT2J362_9PSEU|nr:GntR family transcriptional regulator [Actinophytocola gossypii]MCT2582293.1 GntR family transcriptional regulator [Actinophytocola gossypii]